MSREPPPQHPVDKRERHPAAAGRRFFCFRQRGCHYVGYLLYKIPIRHVQRNGGAIMVVRGADQYLTSCGAVMNLT
jgi:hypothetical protein